ncbi:glycosyltransferase [Lutimonas sp.]|uniref:glycosyltransferase n=1 Tax=Lutimonas sp. TaxID=1872403 RepID=UPI003D9B3FB1
MKRKVLIIGLMWPEPNATAAGTRMMQLIRFFLEHDFDISFASSAAVTELSADLKSLGISCLSIELNSSSFDEQIKNLAPEIVVFDRFISEEQYGWRVHDSCPKALRILDTEDIHFLRRARELALKNKQKDWRSFLYNDTAKREVASMYRCDLSLVISEFEMNLLRKEFRLSPALLFYLPFIDESYADVNFEKYPKFEDRKNFMSLGNFKHKPNVDAVRFLRENIWPQIRKKLPKSDIHIYGAYVPEGIRQLESKKLGFIVKGWISDKSEAYVNYKVCLAPLRFGAGQKGKLLDAMVFGTPSVTSSVGAEGMSVAEQWNGYVTDNDQEFIEKAVSLHQHQELWEEAQSKGRQILNNNFNKSVFEKMFALRVREITENLASHRTENFIGSMLMHHSMQSTKYFSKWIEVKNYLTIK